MRRNLGTGAEEGCWIPWLAPWVELSAGRNRSLVEVGAAAKAVEGDDQGEPDSAVSYPRA